MELAMGEKSLDALRREESRVERLLSEGKMSVIKLDELRDEIQCVLSIEYCEVQLDLTLEIKVAMCCLRDVIIKIEKGLSNSI